MGVQGDPRRAIREIRRRHLNGLSAMSLRLERQFREDVTTKVATPIVSNGEISGFDGSSSRGEFPYAETFQGADNILSGVDRDRMIARVGVRGEDGIGPRDPTHSRAGGLHLIDLADNTVFGLSLIHI